MYLALVSTVVPLTLACVPRLAFFDEHTRTMSCALYGCML